MKLYIAGPMTGLPKMNYPTFEEAAKKLIEAGYEVISPRDYNIIEWIPGMKRALHDVVDANGIAVLDNWKSSRGATLELYIAEQLEIPIKPLEEWLEESHD